MLIRLLDVLFNCGKGVPWRARGPVLNLCDFFGRVTRDLYTADNGVLFPSIWETLVLALDVFVDGMWLEVCYLLPK